MRDCRTWMAIQKCKLKQQQVTIFTFQLGKGHLKSQSLHSLSGTPHEGVCIHTASLSGRLSIDIKRLDVFFKDFGL